MFHKPHQVKRFEEILGVIGLALFVLLGFTSFFLVHFLVTASIEVVRPVHSEVPPPFEFRFELLESGSLGE